MKNFHKIIIVGAGPIGLYFANKCEGNKINYLLLEGGKEPGGQLTNLYPEKEIVDIPNIKSIKAKQYIEKLLCSINQNNLLCEKSVIDIKRNDDYIEVKTKDDTYLCEKLVLATGLGTSTPRPLGVENEKNVSNILYNLNDYSFLKNKKIAIFGGGDSALDWAKQLSQISKNVHLIHRRMEFRGNPETIKNCSDLRLHLPYVPDKINISNGVATSIIIKNVGSNETEKIDVDYIFVNYGNIAQQSSFPFEMEGSFLKVNDLFEVEKNIFAIGDVANYINKIRRIAPGINEAETVFKKIND